MKKVIVLLLVLSFVIIYANSCFPNHDEFLRIWHAENQRWHADEIELIFDWEKSGWVNGTFTYDGIEYPVAVHADVNGASVTAFVYQDASNLKESFDAIYFMSGKVIDDDTFTLRVNDTYREVFDLPKTVTFHRIIDDQTVSTD